MKRTKEKGQILISLILCVCVCRTLRVRFPHTKTCFDHTRRPVCVHFDQVQFYFVLYIKYRTQ